MNVCAPTSRSSARKSRDVLDSRPPAPPQPFLGPLTIGGEAGSGFTETDRKHPDFFGKFRAQTSGFFPGSRQFLGPNRLDFEDPACLRKPSPGAPRALRARWTLEPNLRPDSEPACGRFWPIYIWILSSLEGLNRLILSGSTNQPCHPLSGVLPSLASVHLCRPLESY